MKKKIFITTIILLLVLTTSIVFIRKNKSANATLDTVSLKEVEKDNMFAIMVNDGSGEYTQSDGNDFPTEGYSYNEEKSGCMDNNGEKIENSLIYDSDSNKVTLTTNKTSYCYLYFDKSNAEELLKQLKSTQGLSTDPIGGMYRYQGADTLMGNNVRNYICLSGVGSNGCDASSNGTDDNMYRIIGITEEGNIKVIKQTKYNNKYVWNTKYSTLSSTGSSYRCEVDECPEWPNSEIYTTLNHTFYNTLDNSIQSKIEPQNWWYGDMHFEFVGTLTADEVYQVETGKMNTKYYRYSSSSKGKEVTDEKLKQMDEEAPIGLMYLHDYYYQSKENGCHVLQGSSEYQKCIDNGWMHMKNNGNSSDDEWTMARVGWYGTPSTNFWAWYLNTDGRLDQLPPNNLRSIRPVFYLTNDIVLKGAGTYDNPFYIAN